MAFIVAMTIRKFGFWNLCIHKHQRHCKLKIWTREGLVNYRKITKVANGSLQMGRPTTAPYGEPAISVMLLQATIEKLLAVSKQVTEQED